MRLLPFFYIIGRKYIGQNLHIKKLFYYITIKSRYPKKKFFNLLEYYIRIIYNIVVKYVKVGKEFVNFVQKENNYYKCCVGISIFK
jgi:septum formation topological specificity factor MinE